MIRRTTLLSSVVVAASLILPFCTVSATDTNDVFVRRSLEGYFTEALSMFPPVSSDQVFIEYAPPAVDILNVSGTALGTAMKTIGMQRSGDSASGVGLLINLSDITFRYDSRGGGLFSRGNVYRVLSVSGNFSLLDGSVPIWEDYLVREYSEQIDLSEREDLERSSSHLFIAELPPGPVQKVWEPVIVTSIVGGLVYLFFASR